MLLYPLVNRKKYKNMTEQPEKNIETPLKAVVEKPLSRSEMHKESERRVSAISKELKEGFEFLEDYPYSVTFFGSARLPETDPHYQKARSLAKRIVTELGYSVITGGGPGIMEAANRGAFESKGSSLGITIKLPSEQRLNQFVTDHVPLYYFFTRKVCLSFSAEAFVFFPGGFGTLDEFFEILTLVQTKKINDIPLILVGSDYWKPLEEFLKNELLKRGMIDAEDLNLFSIEDDEDVIMEKIRNAPVRNE